MKITNVEIYHRKTGSHFDHETQERVDDIWTTLAIHVDEWPKLEDFRFERAETLYFAEDHGIVNFFNYNGPGRGFGGRIFDITMKDGSTRDLIGPFSSRAGVPNREGFISCFEVAVHLKGSPVGGCHITVRKARQLMAEWGLAHWDLVPEIKWGEPYWALKKRHGKQPFPEGSVDQAGIVIR